MIVDACCLAATSFGICRSVSSSVLSVASVGDVRIDAAEEPGSILAILLRMLGTDTLERVRNGHRGGISGATDSGVAVSARSLLGRGVSTSSSTRNGGVIGLDSADGVTTRDADFVPNKGDLLPDPFRSLPFPKTAFRKEPFLFRGDLDCVSCAALIVSELLAVLEDPTSRVSLSAVRRMFRRDSRLPDMERL